MDSTGTSLAKSSKKPPRPPVQNTISIKDKEVAEKETEVPIESTMGPNEAIISATKSPALQRALDIIRSAETKAQHKETKEKGKSEMLPPESMEINNNKGIVITNPEDREIIPTVKSFEIYIKGKAKVLEENP
ncbi:uncharacterized protein LOC132044022 [Lycium ferocissimum]|uniref:uncharacterized protein LOC132044022 n=1 Tax=Lycium ferocissimum TaxID=112874 RepID=UPI00281656E6|nr:uncharacterized protein LOC132044022 [Lycium ferocissimum]